MNTLLMVGIMLLASVVISLVGAVGASVLYVVGQSSGLPMSMALSRAALYGGGVFVELMKLCMLSGSLIVAVAALAGLS